jgi:Zn-dependent protease
MKMKFTVLKTSDCEIFVNTTLLVDVLLVIWTLAQGIFPCYYHHITLLTYYWMGAVSVAGLFLSSLFTVGAQIFVCRFTHIPLRMIQLSLFGGIDDSKNEVVSFFNECLVSSAGPFARFALALFFHGLLLFCTQISVSYEVLGVITFLRTINLLLALINCLPFHPLDGGRVMSALVFKFNKNLELVTKICSTTGIVFGSTFMFIGVMFIVYGLFSGGIWWILIGVFVRNGARFKYKMFSVRNILEYEQIKNVMTTSPVIIPLSISIGQYVHDYLFLHHYKVFPVVTASDKYEGILDSNTSYSVNYQVNDHSMVEPRVSYEYCIFEDMVVLKVLEKMISTGLYRLVVTDKERRIVGIVVLNDIVKYLASKIECTQ